MSSGPTSARSGRRWRGPQPGGLYQCCRVPSLVSIHMLASGAAEARRWAARIPSRSRRTVPAARQHRAYSGNNRTSSGHIRAYSGIFGHERIVRAVSSVTGHAVPYGPSRRDSPSPDHVPSGLSRAVSPVAGSRAIRLVVCGIARRRTWRRGRSSRAVSPLAGSRAVRSVAQARLVMSLPVSATSESLPWSRLGEPNTRRLPCSGPTAPVADAATGGLEHIFSCMSVAFNHVPVGGATKASRWAARIPTYRTEPNRPGSRRDRASPDRTRHIRIYPDMSEQPDR